MQNSRWRDKNEKENKKNKLEHPITLKSSMCHSQRHHERHHLAIRQHRMHCLKAQMYPTCLMRVLHVPITFIFEVIFYINKNT